MVIMDKSKFDINSDKSVLIKQFKKTIKSCLVTNIISLFVLLLIVITMFLLIYVLVESKSLEGKKEIFLIAILSSAIVICVAWWQMRLLFFFYTLFVIRNKFNNNDLNFSDFQGWKLLAGLSFNRYFTISILKINSQLYELNENLLK